MEISSQDQIGGDTFSFGPFELAAGQRRLTCRGKPLRLGARAFDLLVALVERAGLPVTKERLVALVWPHTLVEESNLRVHIAALRKLFQEHDGADRFIVNIAGLGYLFSAPVVRNQSAPVASPAHGLTLFGREGVVTALLDRVGDRRLITIAGPAGVGKTCVAQAVAEAIRAQSGRAQSGRAQSGAPVVFVDLSSVEDPAQLPCAIAQALEVDPLADLTLVMADRAMTLVLDTCDHLLDAVAVLAETLLGAAPGLGLLTTSREPLACREEWVCRLAPLAVPAPEPGLTAAQALAYPAVQLFVARAQSCGGGFPFGDEQAGPVAALCARLDGVPLAIERVASRLDLFGLGLTGGDLEERLMLSVRQGRGAGRQASMRAALDWSYDRLSPVEQAVLQRFSVFRGAFPLRAAVEMGAHGALSQGDVLEALASLTAASLIATEPGGAGPLYRLFHLTRAHADEKLEAAAGQQQAPRRHALHLHAGLAAAGQQGDVMARDRRQAIHGSLAQEARAALDWSLSAEGDPDVAGSLMAAALPFGLATLPTDPARRGGGQGPPVREPRGGGGPGRLEPVLEGIPAQRECRVSRKPDERYESGGQALLVHFW